MMVDDVNHNEEAPGPCCKCNTGLMPQPLKRVRGGFRLSFDIWPQSPPPRTPGHRTCEQSDLSSNFLRQVQGRNFHGTKFHCPQDEVSLPSRRSFKCPQDEAEAQMPTKYPPEMDQPLFIPAYEGTRDFPCEGAVGTVRAWSCLEVVALHTTAWLRVGDSVVACW
jgi:hypothetical protein